MKYKIFFRILKVFNILLVSLITFVGIFFINGGIEKIFVTDEINSFIGRGVFEKEIIINGQKVNVHKVSPIYEYEDISRPTFSEVKYNNYYTEYFIGSLADITLTSRNPLRLIDYPMIRQTAGFFANNFYIGHATLNTTDNGDYYIESVGNTEVNGVVENISTWFETEVRAGDDTNRIIGLRVKETTKEDREKIVAEARSKIGLEYNMNFFYKHPNKYYCTDLISRIYEKYGYDINYDGFFSIGNDMILSKNTYIIFYIDRVSSESFNLYYLG